MFSVIVSVIVSGVLYLSCLFLMFIFYKKKVLTKLSQMEEALNHSMVIPENKSQTDTPENQSENIDAFSFILSAVRDRPKDMAELIRTCIAEDGFSSGKKNYTGYQKVAIFLIAIGSDLTNEIYKYLREDEIETITFEITRIEYVEHSQKIAIVQEFYDQLVGYKFISVGGIDYARDILEKSFGTQKAIDFINRLNSSLQLKPFDFIRRVVPLHLLTIIQQEHPQVIALILSYLEPNKASVILENLPYEIQSDVSRRIATMDRTSPEILREIERVLEKKLSTLSSEDYTTAGGVESIVEILNLVDRASEKQIIESLEDEDPELAEEIKKRMFIFEDIIMLDDRAIQKVMREVDSQELAKSLKSVDSEVQNKIFNNMSKRAANMLKEDMDYMGPVRLKDIEEAQQKIVSIVRHLDDIGEIVIVRSGEDELIDSEPFYQKEKTERLLPLEYNQYLLNKSNKSVLNDTDDGTIALAVYGISRNTRKYILSHLNFIRRFKINRLLGELKQVWMDKVNNAQNEIIRRIQLLESDSETKNDEVSVEIS